MAEAVRTPRTGEPRPPSAPAVRAAVRDARARVATGRRPAPPTAPSVRLGGSAVVPASAPAGGRPLAPHVAAPIAASLGVDVSHVRVHSHPAAAAAMGARAFAYGRHIFLGNGAREGDLPLMAHEVAHVVQQQAAPAVQLFTPAGTDRYEREAGRASAAVVARQPFTVFERTTPRVQRLGISDALNYFADKANLIPGFRMFTIILGLNPINMSRVERSAANILRALVEFMPGGGLITQALDRYGVFDRVGTWVEEQINSLGVTGAAIRQALDQFLHSLSFSDIFNLSGVWDRAKEIFTRPIRRIIDFAASLVSGILRFIREAILRPLAELAQGTRGWDLLTAVLGQNPITGEPVPRNAETLIGGFMKLIGQEEVWNNLKQARAVERAWAWFQGALQGLLGFIRQIPTLFVSALNELEIADIVLLPRAFAKVARVFGSFALSIVTWAGQQVLSLLQIIFEVLAPDAVPYLHKAAGAFRTIIMDPIRFIGNLIRAGIQGFRQFGANFLTHLRNSLIQWLTGTLAGANVYIPQAFELREIIKFVLSVLGLTWANVRQKLVRLIPESVVTVLERTFDIVVTLVREGPAAAWDKIKEQISNLKEMVMEQVMTFVRDRIVQAAITRLVTSLNPAGAFIQAVIAIYNTIMFFIERLQQIKRVAMSVIDSIAAIASGAIGAAANRVEQTMAGLLTLVISFLARLVGLGKVSDAVTNVINRIRAPIDRALDRVVEWIVSTARRLGRLAVGGAQRVAGRLGSLLGIRRPIRLENGESHSLYFEQRGERPVLYVASNPVAFRAFVNTIGSRPELGADKSYAIRLIDEIDRLEDQSLATNVDNSARITTLLEELGRTATNLMNRAGRSDVRSTPPAYAGLVNGFGRGMRVMLVTNDIRPGTRPGLTNATFQDLNRRREGSGSYYILGHLLNEHLGGPGTFWENITPLSRAGNSAHERHVESIIKPVEGVVPRAFLYVVTPSYGRALNTGLIAAINAATNPDAPTAKALKVRIVTAEHFVTTALICSIREIDPLSGRNTGMQETYTIPNEVRQGSPGDYQV